MSNVNSVVIAGNLVRDPELRQIASGTSILEFAVAVNESRKNSSGEWEDVPSYFDVKVWGTRAESLSRFLSKGSKVTVQGRLKQERWEKDGEKRSKVVVIADNVELPPKGSGSSHSEPKPDPIDDDIPFHHLPYDSLGTTRCGHMRW